MNFKEILDLSIEAVLEAGAAVEILSDSTPGSHQKDSGSSQASRIVTEADFKSQEIILEKLSPFISKYNLGLLTEEKDDDLSRLKCDYYLAIDPLDGTLPYSRGISGYSISIALINKRGEPLIGVVYDPSRKNLYTAIKGEGVYKNGAPFRAETSKAISWVFDGSLRSDPNFNSYREYLLNYGAEKGLKLNEIDYGGAIFNAIYIMENPPGIYFKPPKNSEGGGAIWDFSSTNLFYRELNSSYNSTDFTGKGLLFNRKSIFFNDTGVIYSSSPELLHIKEIEFD